MIVHENNSAKHLLNIRSPTAICLFYVRKACCGEENEPVMVNQRSINKAVLEDRNHGFNLGVTEIWGRALSIRPVFQAGDSSPGHV